MANFHLGTIHLRRQHVLGGEGCPRVPMVKRSQYIKIKNLIHKHFAGMLIVGGRGQKSWKFADVLNEWSHNTILVKACDVFTR